MSHHLQQVFVVAVAFGCMRDLAPRTAASSSRATTNERLRSGAVLAVGGITRVVIDRSCVGRADLVTGRADLVTLCDACPKEMTDDVSDMTTVVPPLVAGPTWRLPDLNDLAMISQL